MKSEKRFFIPRRVDDLIPEAIPWIGKSVTVDGWFPPWDAPDDETRLRGHVIEFEADVPEYELISCTGPGLLFKDIEQVVPEAHGCEGRIQKELRQQILGPELLLAQEIEPFGDYG